MKKIIRLLVISLFILTSCKNNQDQKEGKDVVKQEVSYVFFGAEISDDQAISKKEMSEKYHALKEGDTLQVKFKSSINEVCSKKGCWMKLDLGNDQEALVKFKDYGFFMPLNSDDREVIVRGKAFLQVTSVEELQHLAKDAGKSVEEIAKITSPERTLSFEADGVLMVQ